MSEQVEDKLLDIAYQRATESISKLDPMIGMMAGTFARKKLYDLEKQLYDKGATKEEAQSVRPAKNEDPLLKLLKIVIGGTKEFLTDVEFAIATDGNEQITDITIKLPNQSKTG